MKPANQKILAEVVLEEKKSQSGIVLADEKKHAYLRARVLGAGDDTGIVEGDEIVVFGVYEAQIHDYEGKKLIFVDNNEGQFFKI